MTGRGMSNKFLYSYCLSVVEYVPRPLSSPLYATTKECCESKDPPPTPGKRTAKNKRNLNMISLKIKRSLWSIQNISKEFII
jgi:hypothetical protein